MLNVVIMHKNVSRLMLAFKSEKELTLTIYSLSAIFLRCK